MELFLMIFGSLFSVMNPFGTVPIFASLTTQHTKSERNKVALSTALNVMLILLISFFIGQFILIFFGISLNSLKIAGGLIIASSGFALLRGEFTKHKGMKKEPVKKDLQTRSEIALTPLAMPMLAGPGTISLVISYNQQFTAISEIIITVAAIITAALSIYIILKSSFTIAKSLGASGINALSRIIGFVIIAIGVEFITSALADIFM